MNNCSVMQNGFQFATGEGRCITFLFYGWNVDSHAKYAASIIGVFCMSVLNAGLGYIRHLINDHYENNPYTLSHHISLAVVYGVQMVLAYWLMLLVMTYESGIFMSLIFGLIIGYFVFGYIRARNLLASKTLMPTSYSAYDNQFNNTPCCQAFT
ncbi:unnamed protein product [Rotaria socialis]|uniref:Copper transport protein n=2 Tax=Rotaria socialis TaxID=392032 RepID=A0A818VEE3_9BILA|nr:unnamed protein product [Rotaria socialis]CAF3646562.1 unnamed protein product [Rotaria socialis]CAF3704974.1 unnamed protein product [Rotaria socialis]